MMRFVVTIALLICTALGAVRSASDDLSVTIDPMVFEFGAQYGSEQQGTVTVSNSGVSSEQIRIRAIDWNVTSDGTVNILPVQSASAHSLAPYLQASPATFTLSGGESRTISVSLHLPVKGRSSPTTLWGGFLVEGSARDGRSLVHPGATILIYDSTSQFRPELRLKSVSLGRSTTPQIVAHVINTSASYARPVAHLLLKRGNNVVRDEQIPVNVILPGADRWLRASIPQAPKGRYQAELLIDYGPGILDGVTNVQVP